MGTTSYSLSQNITLKTKQKKTKVEKQNQGFVSNNTFIWKKKRHKDYYNKVGQYHFIHKSQWLEFSNYSWKVESK